MEQHGGVADLFWFANSNRTSRTKKKDLLITIRPLAPIYGVMTAGRQTRSLNVVADLRTPTMSATLEADGSDLAALLARGYLRLTQKPSQLAVSRHFDRKKRLDVERGDSLIGIGHRPSVKSMPFGK